MIGELRTDVREATVVGAGIAGLMMAHTLDRRGFKVTLLEASERVGGLISTRVTPFGIAETAAHSTLVTPPVKRFFEELEIELIPPLHRARYILRKGRMRRFPLGFGEALQMLTRAAFTKAQPGNERMTMEEWARHHLGQAAAEYLISPFIRGIYGAEPTEIGVETAFPRLSVTPGKSLLGTVFGRERKERAKLMAPRKGMGELVTKLESSLMQSLGERFRVGQTVRELPNTPNLILCVPAPEAARLLAGADPVLDEALRAIRYVSLASVTAFVRREDLARPYEGIGVLFPKREHRESLGVLFSSSAFAGRVEDPSKIASYTVMLGGSTRPDLPAAPEEAVARVAVDELRSLLGLKAEPAHVEVSRWPRAVPSYGPDLPYVWEIARRGWCSQPGRLLFGNYTGQVSIRGMIETIDAMPPA
jgi:protoporphyrinogen/coproporphyrinogen III oxidase